MRDLEILRAGGTFRPDDRDAKGLRIINRSNTNPLVVYLDGRPPTYDERFFGSNRERLEILPGGWGTVPLWFSGHVGLGADGRLFGDPIMETYPDDGTFGRYSSSIPCSIEELNDEPPLFAFKPDRVRLGSWQNVARATDYYSLEDRDPDFRLPQVRGAVIGFWNQVESGTGADGYSSLEVYDGRHGAGEFWSVDKISIGGSKENYCEKRQTVYFRADALCGIRGKSDEANTRLNSGEIFYQFAPIDRVITKQVASGTWGVGYVLPFGYYTCRHLKKLRVVWNTDGFTGGPCSIIATHRAADSASSFPESADVITETNTDGAVEFTPLAEYIELNVDLTAATGGGITISVLVDREYRP